MKKFPTRNFGTKVQGRAEVFVMDAITGLPVSRVKASNMVFDSGLNDLANGIGYADFFSQCVVGGSTYPNSVASGAVTFTQAGNIITASTPGWFNTTGVNAGAIFKYGTGSGGAEQYIATIDATGNFCTVSGAGMTVATGTAATVWNVQLGALQAAVLVSGSPLGFLRTTSYLAGSANNSTTFTTTTATMKRTFLYAVQAQNYSVNEIGYGSASSSGANCNGRVKLGSTVVVSTSQFLQVVWTIVFTPSPATPGTLSAPVINFGGTNINAGNLTAGLLFWDCRFVAATGASTPTDGNLFDQSNTVFIGLAASAWSFAGTIGASSGITPISILYRIGPVGISNAGQTVGVGFGTVTFSITTAGETVAGLLFGNSFNTSLVAATFAINFTNAQTLPTGNFAGSYSIRNTFTRTLTN